MTAAQMFARRVLPIAAACMTSAAIGWHAREQQLISALEKNPGGVTKALVAKTQNPSAVAAAIVVQVANPFVNMAGCVLTDQITPGPTRRSLSLNVYSRMAAGARVWMIDPEHNAVLLVQNKRKPGKLLPSEGYGHYGPPRGVEAHDADVPPHLKDKAEEAILRGTSVDAAYQEAAGAQGAGRYPYGVYDKTFEETAMREVREELGVLLVSKDLKFVNQETPYNERWGLHTCVTSFYTDAVRRETPLTLDFDEIKSAGWFSFSEITRNSDGSAKVEGVEGVIPQGYAQDLEKAATVSFERQLSIMTYGDVQTLDQLRQRAKQMGKDCPAFTAFGEQAEASRAKILALAKAAKDSRESALWFNTLTAGFKKNETAPGEGITSVPSC